MRLTKAFLSQLAKNPIESIQDLSTDDIAKIIQKANDAYYNKKDPILTDNVYDIIRDYLENKVPDHPILKNIGAAPKTRKSKLPFTMGSLDKIKTEDFKIIDKFKNAYPGTYVISDKLDGNSALFYKNRLYSRGDGQIGQDITHLVAIIKGLKKLDDDDIAIRGELIIAKKDFKQEWGANARNTVAGIVNAKVPDLTIAKHIQFVAYELIIPSIKPEAQFTLLEKLGFQTAYHKAIKDISLDILSEYLAERRAKSPFEIDGIVVAHNGVHERPNEGNPAYAFAFKNLHTQDEAEVIVTFVEYNMSKDKMLVPVVNFDGVNLDGVVIKRAHGFNAKFIKDNGIGPGAKIIIIRSGSVIPYIKSITQPAAEPQMPDETFVWSKTGVDAIAVEGDDQVEFKNLEYFFNKVDVKGVSTGNLRKIFDAGYKTVKEVFDLNEDSLKKVPGFKDKMSANIFNALNETKPKLDCLTLMDASNTLGRGIGRRKLEMLGDLLPKIQGQRYIPSEAELIACKGIEKTTADLIRQNLPKFFKFLDDNKLADICKAPAAGPSKASKAANLNLKVVLTGFRSKELEAKVEALGGKVMTSVSSTTTHVICKDITEDSTKIKKAKDLGITIITKEEFEKTYLK